ncbi:VanZ family protein [Pseudoalteromonas sp. T1lg75]|uniref:VanZ family protein n=1 Tax=Pseudoalteromonas sp. T1lg75 TaxID=2077102 RepID=UPI000CF707BF|nr:VanZ family protein [Pseudoalteromonas sp. T1lg75]
MTRRVYKGLFLISLVVFTLLFAKEVKGAAVNLFPHIDKVAHFGIFFILAFIMDKAFKIPFIIQVILLCLYGAAIEWMQGMLPHRQASVADFVADACGAASYFVLHYIWQTRWQKKNS